MDLFRDSELELGRNSESGWLSEKEKNKGKQREKRKMNQKNGNEKKKFRSKYSGLPDLREVFQEVRDKKQLAVRCGKMAGYLHRIKYDIGEDCILCRGKWYSPKQFEVIGGKKHNKKWKVSIYYMPSNGFQQVQLLKLIKSGVLPEFGHLRESFKQVTKTDKGSPNSKAVQNMMRSELMNALKGFPESWKRLFSKTVSIPVCGIEENTLQRETIQPAREMATHHDLLRAVHIFRLEFMPFYVNKINAEPIQQQSCDSSSDESRSVAERVKMKRRESVNSTVGKKATEPVGSTSSDRDSLAHPVDPSEPGVSPVVEEAVQTTDDPTGAAPLSFSAAPERQDPVASEETQETKQLQLYEFLAKQFNTINNTLQSIDLSLKKLVEMQSHDSLSQYISVTPSVIENPQIRSLVKQV